MSLRNDLAPTPPRGWNSYDCFGGEVTEAEVRANAEYLARHLLPYGWDTVVIDIAWHSHRSMADYCPECLDAWGRLLPHPERFPSSRGGVGFKPLADYCHSLGLKFGIHVMPGIPLVAIEAGCPVQGTTCRAGDLTRRETSNSLWPNHLYYPDWQHPQAQAYYDSLFQLYAAWGVDFVKADGTGYPYLPQELEALDLARRRCGRDIILSLSSGMPWDSSAAEHRRNHCEMWRVTEDLWDRWPQLERAFTVMRTWAPTVQPGCWVDLDMLPLGRIGIRQHPDNSPDRQSAFTHGEQTMLVTLCAIAQCPLMMGGDLPSNDAWTLALLTNPEVLAINSTGRRPHELFHNCHYSAHVWACELPGGAWAVAVSNFNAQRAREVTVDFREYLAMPSAAIRDCWARRDLGRHERQITVSVPAHGAVLLKLTP